ncbi:MAG: hypothetical protein K6F80_00725 [Oscillospiraceae bacterium]|nr:hypothetical protein [Oscillospiraceae bacterium]
MDRKQCVRCLNNSTVRRMSLDDSGQCCYCTRYDRIRSQLEDRERLSELFRQRIEQVRGKYPYDAAVGISGGKDSMYVLYQLVRVYGLKVRAFTMRNGFFSPQAQANTDRIVQELGVEHSYIDFDPSLLKRFFRYSMQHWLTPCIACSYIGYAAMINYTAKIGAGLCIHGRSPQQMLRYYGDDVFTGFVDAGLRPPQEVDVQALYQELLGLTGTHLDKSIAGDVRGILFDGVKAEDFREFVPFFLYHPYEESQIVQFLRENTSWSPSQDYDHYDCTIHHAAHYIYQCAEGRPHCLPEISVLVRSGKLSREEGLRLTEHARYHEKPAEALHTLCDTVGLREEPLFLKAWLYRHLVKK